mgnify:CR=1 FL=1
MKRQCTLCKQEFLHGKVEKLHDHLNLCFDCQEAITKVVKGWILD